MMTPSDFIFALAFWLSIGLVAYAYLGYPVLIWALARTFGRRPQAPPAPQEWPAVSLLIAAHNEESDIGKRIEDALSLDYPPEKLEIVIASDGSSDRTCGIIKKYANRGVRLLDFQERIGKPAVLNRSVPQLSGEIVAFSDANSFNEPDAIKNLVRWFGDPQVGAVCGKLILIDSMTGQNVDDIYWKYENFLKRCEGRLGGLLGANGAIYALRREWYPLIPDNTIIDDFVIPLRMKLQNHSRIVYDSEAIAHEETPKAIRAEFKRRSRIGAGGFQAIGLLWKLLHPRFGWTAFTFLNHKILRWFGPFFLILALLSNLVLLHIPFFQWMLIPQIVFYVLAMLGAYLPSQAKIMRLMRVTSMFTSMNAALLFGFFRWLFGTQQAAWQRTPRLAESVEASQ